jgi:nitric oxide synthase oxygenase domain/subunit
MAVKKKGAKEASMIIEHTNHWREVKSTGEFTPAIPPSSPCYITIFHLRLKSFNWSPVI